METELIVLLIGTLGMFLMISAFLFFAYRYQKKIFRKEREKKEIEELLKSEELKSMYAQLEGKDSERERIAHDLHDRMGGQLSTLKMYLDLLEQSEMAQEKTELLKKLQFMTTGAIDEIRSIAHDLGGSTLNRLGLEKAIEKLCEAINETKKLTVTWYTSIDTEVSNELRKDIYQVIQELITNTLRHSEASTINIEVNAIDNELNLIYEDNGVGMSPSAIEGMGLKSIRMRVKRYDGELTIDTPTFGGTTFIIEIPL